MVKEISYFECEICKTKHDNKVDALQCEAKGLPDLYPKGMVFMVDEDNPMIFAVIKQYPKYYPHHHAYSTWACRDTNAGDNAGKECYCGLESWDKIYPPNKELPAYERMIKALKKNKFKVTDYKQ